jgi:PAB-dependent poly(A)-specific ribonuclease subunit 2
VQGFQPQVFGAPVSALAYDTHHEAMFVASVAQSMGRGRYHNHRASMLVTHSTLDAMLYSSVAGQPEAPPKVLNAIYESVYGSPASRLAGGRPNGLLPPSHAFTPPYGVADPALPEAGPGRLYQMGIRTLLPTGQGYVASIAPSGVRLHSHGGLQLVDHHVEGLLCGTCPQHGDGSPATHLTVGGRALGKELSAKSGTQQVLCLDLWQDLRVIASYTIDRGGDTNTAVTAMATLEARNAVVAGCTDGSIRMVDSRLRETAKIKSHFGGVTSLAASLDGTLLASTGYGSRGQAGMESLYAFPDPTVFLYDMRYLGRGGIPHSFAGVGAGPRFVDFLPAMDGQASNRFIVASGQAGGGLHIIEPFQESVDARSSNFLVPALERGESITAMSLSEDRLGLGTSRGNVMQYRLAGFGPATSKKKILELPSFTPPLPALSLDPALLSSPDPASRNGMTDAIKSIFSAYILTKEANVSALGNRSFGPLMSNPLVGGSKLQVSSRLLQSATHSVDFVQTIPTSNLEVDLFADHRSQKKDRSGSRLQPKQNPNKLLQCSKLYSLAYEESFNRSKKGSRQGRSKDGADGGEDNLMDIPTLYRLTMRPGGKLAGLFSHADRNSTGMLPGWDYPPTMPNAFVPPILMLLYCIPETRMLMLRAQTAERANATWKDKSLTPEIGFLFHRIDALARTGLIFPSSFPGKMVHLEAWAPMNFMSCLASTPEAEQLQILDGSPAAADMPRRAEAFYRFILYQIDKEAVRGKPMDSFGGIDFTSVNEFVSGAGPPSTSSTRAMTVELYYGPFLSKDEPSSFGDVLQLSLCREMRLRAWNQKSDSYETIVQRKIATSLPTLLSVSCVCAGRKEEEGLKLWRGRIPFGWLPERIEIELPTNGTVIVREENLDKETNQQVWKEYEGTGSIPDFVSDLIAQRKSQSAPSKRRYRLEAVVPLIRDDFDRKSVDEIAGAVGTDVFGHQILHQRVPNAVALRVFNSQLQEVSAVIGRLSSLGMTIVGASEKDNLLERQRRLEDKIKDVESRESEDNWYAMNGYVVSPSSSRDARAFHQRFKEPSICLFRAEDSLDAAVASFESDFTVPPDVIRTLSLTNGAKSPHAANQKPEALPREGDLVAFDAEFVSVQEEVSTLTERGAKTTIQEPRFSIARISVLDTRSTGAILFDDHVVPREPVVDYLTRFSGIVAKDLDPKQSPHHLISTRAGYLKLRYLVERGCIFVGHGLKQDFWTSNLVVPPCQIIDTVEIYHKPAQRYVSLRFLANFVLRRDMQQDIHDSVEDATAAFELYKKAVALKGLGKFDELLDDLYAHGQNADWKVGVEEA